MNKTLALLMVVAGCLFASQKSQAQSFRYANDALRYSRYTPGGSARMVGIGGAQAALGGDISSAYSNPAGLGFYNRSEVSITPSFYNSANDAYYLAPNGNNGSRSQASYEYKTNFGLSNLGIVFNRSKKTEDRNGWLGGSFAITYQRTNQFHDRFMFEGQNTDNYFADILPILTKGRLSDLENPTDPLVGAAYDAELIDIFEDVDDPSANRFYYDANIPFPDEEFPILQRDVIRTRGSQSQINLAYGGNMSDKIYIGVGLGLSSINHNYRTRYQETASPTYYTEFPDDVDYYPVNRFTYEVDRTTSGGGINATLGIIARPIEAVTIGLSYQTPTINQLTEEESGVFTTSFMNRSGTGFGTYRNTFEYNLKTPGRLTGGAAFFVEKWGFISADVEYTNYAGARLTDDFGDLNLDTDSIRSDYQSAINYRIGGELRFNILRLRAGYAHQGNPFKSDVNFDGSSTIYSLGGGLRFKNYYVDLALSQQRSYRFHQPYDLGPDISPSVEIENRATSAFLTVGFSF